MTRLLPALLSGVAVGAAGIRHGARMKAEAACMARWCAILAHLSLLLEDGAYPLPEALEYAADRSGRPDELLRKLARALREQPLTPLPEHFAALEGGEPARPVLLRLFQQISRGSRTERVFACKQACAELTLLTGEARQKADRDARMWTSLGWTLGACLSLMLL